MPGGGSVTITTNVVETDEQILTTLGPGRYARISVSDTGIGMSPKVIEQAVEPFFTTKPLGKGTGLGLSQVYEFITQSGGEVLISSVEGEGTSIDLYLPLAQPVKHPDTQQPSPLRK